MSKIYHEIKELIATGQVKISEHGYDELADDNIYIHELLNGIDKAEIVEEYPDYPKGKCILLLSRDLNKQPLHSLWGIPKGYQAPAVLVTAYRPDPDRWDQTFKNRRST